MSHGTRSERVARPLRYLRTGRFDKRAQAESLILDLESAGNVTDTHIHGMHWNHREDVVESIRLCVLRQAAALPAGVLTSRCSDEPVT